MLELSLPFTHEIEVAATPQATFDLLADVPASASHFPNLEGVHPEPAGAWTWSLEKIGIGKVFVQTTYALRYTKRPEEHTILWEPVAGVGNGLSRGSWVIGEVPGGARLRFENVLDVKFRGLPRLLRRVVEPFAVEENAKLIRAYMANIASTLSGGDGRVAR